MNCAQKISTEVKYQSIKNLKKNGSGSEDI